MRSARDLRTSVRANRATRRIVARLRVEALFAQADAIEAAVNVARQRAAAKRVDQAILARAFRGEL